MNKQNKVSLQEKKIEILKNKLEEATGKKVILKESDADYNRKVRITEGFKTLLQKLYTVVEKSNNDKNYKIYNIIDSLVENIEKLIEKIEV